MNKILVSVCCLFAVSATVFAGEDSPGARLEKAMNGEHRSAANIARNQYRHPAETIEFFGLKEGMTVMEIWPGGGWYTEILAPAIRDHGSFIVAGYDVDVPDQPDYRYRLQKSMLEKFAARPDLYDQVGVVAFSPPQSASLGDADSIDLLVTFRNTHGWVGEGIAADIYAEFARVLKPGGVLGVVQHRAADGVDPAESAGMGYVSEAAVIAMAEAVGLVLEDRSEINANPRDSKDHAKGVWSLPPSLSICRDVEDEAGKAECQANWQAIGESDRMTLKFRKPKDA